MNGLWKGFGAPGKATKPRRIIALALTFAMVAELIPAQALRAMLPAPMADAVVRTEALAEDETTTDASAEGLADEEVHEPPLAPADELSADAALIVEWAAAAQAEAQPEAMRTMSLLGAELDGEVAAAADDGTTTVSTAAELAVALSEKDGGATVQLANDIETSASLLVNGAKTLDLAGHTLLLGRGIFVGYNNYTSATTNDGYKTDDSQSATSLTVSDSASGGIIRAAEFNDSTQVLVRVYAGASFTMEGGTLAADLGAVGKDHFGVSAFGKGTKLTITGGTITAGAYAFSTNNLLSSDTVFNVNGGTLESTLDYTIYGADASGTINVAAGTVVGAVGAISTNAGNIEISGGTLRCTGTGNTGTGTDGTNGQGRAVVNVLSKYSSTETTISGGNFVTTTGVPIIAAVVDRTGATTQPEKQITVDITGGTFNANPTAALSDVANVELNKNNNSQVAKYNAATGSYEMTDGSEGLHATLVTSTMIGYKGADPITDRVIGSDNLKITLGGQPLTEDYEISYSLVEPDGTTSTPTKVEKFGTYTITVTSTTDSSYSDSVVFNYVGVANAELEIGELSYTGAAVTPVVKYKGMDGASHDIAELGTYATTYKNSAGTVITANDLVNAGSYPVEISVTTTDNNSVVTLKGAFKIVPVALGGTLDMGEGAEPLPVVYTDNSTKLVWKDNTSGSGTDDKYVAELDLDSKVYFRYLDADGNLGQQELKLNTDYTVADNKIHTDDPGTQGTGTAKIVAATGNDNFTGTAEISFTADEAVAKDASGKEYTSLQDAIDTVTGKRCHGREACRDLPGHGGRAEA